MSQDPTRCSSSSSSNTESNSSSTSSMGNSRPPFVLCRAGLDDCPMADTGPSAASSSAHANLPSAMRRKATTEPEGHCWRNSRPAAERGADYLTESADPDTLCGDRQGVRSRAVAKQFANEMVQKYVAATLCFRVFLGVFGVQASCRHYIHSMRRRRRARFSPVGLEGWLASSAALIGAQAGRSTWAGRNRTAQNDQ